MKYKVSPEDLVNSLAVARQNKAQIEASITAMEDQLIQIMESEQRKTLKVGTHQVTYVRSTRVMVDESGLRKALGAKVFDKYTVSKLDRKKLEQALDNGEVDPHTVSPYVREESGNPYIRFTEKKEAK